MHTAPGLFTVAAYTSRVISTLHSSCSRASLAPDSRRHQLWGQHLAVTVYVPRQIHPVRYSCLFVHPVTSHTAQHSVAECFLLDLADLSHSPHPSPKAAGRTESVVRLPSSSPSKWPGLPDGVLFSLTCRTMKLRHRGAAVSRRDRGPFGSTPCVAQCCPCDHIH